MKAKLHNGKKPAKNHPWRKTSPDWLRRSEYKSLASPMVGCMHSRRGKAPC